MKYVVKVRDLYLDALGGPRPEDKPVRWVTSREDATTYATRQAALSSAIFWGGRVVKVVSGRRRGWRARNLVERAEDIIRGALPTATICTWLDDARSFLRPTSTKTPEKP